MTAIRSELEPDALAIFVDALHYRLQVVPVPPLLWLFLLPQQVDVGGELPLAHVLLV